MGNEKDKNDIGKFGSNLIVLGIILGIIGIIGAAIGVDIVSQGVFWGAFGGGVFVLYVVMEIIMIYKHMSPKFDWKLESFGQLIGENLVYIFLSLYLGFVVIGLGCMIGIIVGFITMAVTGIIWLAQEYPEMLIGLGVLLGIGVLLLLLKWVLWEHILKNNAGEYVEPAKNGRRKKR